MKQLLPAIIAMPLLATAAQAYSIRLDYTGAAYRCIVPAACGTEVVTDRTGSVTIDMDKLGLTSLANIRISGYAEGFLNADPDNPRYYSGYRDLTNPNSSFTEVGSYRAFADFDGVFDFAWEWFDGGFGERFRIDFDSSGNVSEWDVGTSGDSSLAYITSESGDYQGYYFGPTFNGDHAWESDGPGTWTTTVIGPAPVPLPATLPLGAAALAGLAMFRRRSVKRLSVKAA